MTIDVDDVYFRDRIDPSDKRYRLIEMRIPAERGQASNYGPHEYTGIRPVLDRLRRFSAAILESIGDITHAHGQRIQKACEQTAANAAARDTKTSS
jgi:hypothetical protein